MDNQLIEQKVEMLSFPEMGDERGHLVVVEGMKQVPFPIARIFYIYGSDTDVIRGCHANRKSEFVLINICGSSKVKVKDGKEEIIYELNRSHMGIYLPRMIWKEMYDFSEDSILLCLSSEPYDAAEYIRDYSEYIQEMNGKR
ncbi:MAG: FdtA/QdtA family cupin domain-containing protein [Eubacteriales bacterium]